MNPDFDGDTLAMSSESRNSCIEQSSRTACASRFGPNFGGEKALTEVKSVSACEVTRDPASSRIEVSPLSRLFPDVHFELDSIGLFALSNRVEDEKLNGKGGTGRFGTMPDCWLQRLVDLGRQYPRL